ncbi:S-adenosyl-L-methionine-dependent methyltransferase [Auriculariales sp. MPI-PUGE-AT-0066]|nr:S-adenosyl-L-methionine-dependent methyltransferase [Auriculariales sp. MPI-PUGE-AT-0066]
MQSTQDVAALQEPLQLLQLIEKSTKAILDAYSHAGLPLPELDSDHRPDAALLTPDVRVATRILEGACAQLIATVVHPGHLMMNRSHGSVESATLQVAIRAGVANQLLDGPKHISDISRTAKMDEGKLAAVMRNLANKHCFRAVAKNTYANNRLSMALLEEDPFGSFVAIGSDEYTQAIVHLADFMADPITGKSHQADTSTFSRVFGKSVFELYAEDTTKAARFGHGMQAWTSIHGGHDTLANTFPWRSVSEGTKVCDIGGNHGYVSRALLKAHPHLRVVVQDLPDVISRAQKIWEMECPELLREAKAELVPVDFFKEPLYPGCDYYYLKHVLHDWPAVDCISILKNIRAAIGTGEGRVLIHEFILVDAGDLPPNVKAPIPLLPDYGYGTLRKYNIDIHMHASFNSGERTLENYTLIAQEGGFKVVETYFDGETTIIELEVASPAVRMDGSTRGTST